LLTSSSNAGVDNLLDAVSRTKGKKVNMTRIGNPSRVNPKNSDFIFDNHLKRKLKGSTDYKKAKREFQTLMGKIDSAKGSDYNKRKKVEEIREKANQLLFQMGEYEKVAAEEIITESNVIATTLSSIYDRQLKSLFGPGSSTKKLFDVVIIDEAGQCIDILAWMGVVHGQRIIMAGDHKQLPPTIKSPENEITHLTLFEKLMNFHKENQTISQYSTMLRNQYRMNSQIMNISSEYLYDNLLVADQSVSNEVLKASIFRNNDKIDSTEDTHSNMIISEKDLLEEKNLEAKENNEISVFGLPLVFFDTSGCLFGENEKSIDEQNLFQKSKYNDGEADLSSFVTLILIKHYNLSPCDIGIITPYSAQVDNIRRALEVLQVQGKIEQGVEVSTVDGFQGREKEVIIISTVRSNSKREIGFLKDTRRMNVAITRAKKLLCVIGDSSTVKNSDFIQFAINKISISGIIKNPIDLNLEQVDGVVFNYNNFYKSGVYKENLASKDKKKIPKEKNLAKGKEDEKVKTQNNEININKNSNEKVVVEQICEEKEDAGLQEYFEDMLKEFLASENSTMSIYRKLNEQEFKMLSKVSASMSISFEKQKKQILLKKQESSSSKPPKDFEIVGELNESTSFIVINEPKSEKVKCQKQKQKKLNDEELRLENEKFIEEYALQRQLMREKCYFKPEGSHVICGKNIKLLFQECKFCCNFFCTFHGLPESHGCGDQAREDARNKAHMAFKNEKYDIGKPIDDFFLKQKVKEKLADAQAKRAPKPKKKKK
jgi:hypothetical protein